MVGSATLAMAPSITAMMRPSAIVRIAQCRCGSGRPSACSMVVDEAWKIAANLSEPSGLRP
jgi:hypothetical protein